MSTIAPSSETPAGGAEIPAAPEDGDPTAPRDTGPADASSPDAGIAAIVAEIRALQEDRGRQHAAVAALLDEAMTTLRARAEREAPGAAGRKQEDAATAFADVKARLLAAGSGLDDPGFDAEGFLRSYDDAVVAMAANCRPPDPAAAPAGWDGADTGAYGCSVLSQMDVGIRDLLATLAGRPEDDPDRTPLKLQARAEVLQHLDDNRSNAFRIGAGVDFDPGAPGGPIFETGVSAYQRIDIDTAAVPPDTRFIRGPQAYTGAGWAFGDAAALWLDGYFSLDRKSVVSATGTAATAPALAADLVLRCEYRGLYAVLGYKGEDSAYAGVGLSARFNTPRFRDLAPVQTSPHAPAGLAPAAALQYHLQMTANAALDANGLLYALPAAGLKARLGPARRFIVQTGLGYFLGGSGDPQDTDTPITFATGPQVYVGGGVQPRSDLPLEVLANLAVENTRTVYLGNAGEPTATEAINADAAVLLNYRFLTVTGGYSTALDAPFVGVGIYYDGDLINGNQ